MPQQFWPFGLHLAAKGSRFTQSSDPAGDDLGWSMGWALLSTLAWLIITLIVAYHGYMLCITTGSRQWVMTSMGHPSNNQYGSFKVCSYIFAHTVKDSSHITVSSPITQTWFSVRGILTAPYHMLCRPPFLLQRFLEAWNFAWQVMCPVLAKDGIN